VSQRVAVAGASGYAGGEILRLLEQHPEFEVVTVAGHSTAGQPLIQQQPHLRSLAHLTLQEISAETLSGHDVVFFALPHGASGALADQLERVQLVVDCGADHRLERQEDWDRFYGESFHQPWTYGVPELFTSTHGSTHKQRENIAQATRIAAPGCNASTVSLSLAPGIHANIIEAEDIVSVLAVGPSGAGKSVKPHLLGAELLGSANPYAIGNSHRHIPEVIQALRNAGARSEPTLTFTPVLVPMSRGILATSSARLRPGVTADDVTEAWHDAYRDEPFVHVLTDGTVARTADVLGANTCLMSLNVDEVSRRVTVVAAVDNLVKGTAGAAIQSVNIALGLDETLGLSVNGVAP
jgi:N-acetyl-gamma-glutamyl-phosphate reductase